MGKKQKKAKKSKFVFLVIGSQRVDRIEVRGESSLYVTWTVAIYTKHKDAMRHKRNAYEGARAAGDKIRESRNPPPGVPVPGIYDNSTVPQLYKYKPEFDNQWDPAKPDVGPDWDSTDSVHYEVKRWSLYRSTDDCVIEQIDARARRNGMNSLRRDVMVYIPKGRLRQ